MSVRQDRAAIFFGDWLKRHSDEISDADLISMLIKLLEYADKDFADCSTNTQKQKIWSVIVSALWAVMAKKGHKSEVLTALKSALQNTAIGAAGDHGLHAENVNPQRKSVDEEWSRARVIAALDLFSEKTEVIVERAHVILGCNKQAVRKLRENYKTGKIGQPYLDRLVKTAHDMHVNGINVFDDLLDKSTP